MSWLEVKDFSVAPTIRTATTEDLAPWEPGHETYPSYYNEQVQKVIKNAISWCAPTENTYPTYGHYQAREDV